MLMRIDGTLTKWNDDRGFGFITPTQGGPEVFAHISAFPRDGQRPRLGERLSFEIGIGKDGKQQAKNIVCPTRPAEKPYRLSEPARRPDKPGLLGRLIPLAFVVALGAYGYNEYTHRPTPQTAYEAPSRETTAPSPFHCDGRTHCSQMTSCAEAEFFLSNCPNVEMDGNHDGEPCEQQWCN
ncbi:MAG: cold shock domain-containing protein [Burkholderiales bacterium]